MQGRTLDHIRTGAGGGALSRGRRGRLLEPGGDMCKLLAKQDPRCFRQTSRSLRIWGQSTSVRLEEAFWNILGDIADSQGMTVPRLVAILHDEATENHGNVSNLASLLRTTCLIYERERAERATRGSAE